MSASATAPRETAISAAELFDRLREFEVLDESVLDALWDELPASDRWQEAGDYAAGLVESGQLTKFQAQVLLAGRGRTLVLGQYLILDEIGAGGMGQVYRARHRRMKREVALKVLPTTITKNPDAVKRFAREAEAAAKLAHPNIVAAHDAGEDQGVHYLAMEFVEGSDLASLVKKQGPLRVELALWYVVQAARGLGHAHGRGVIHRDIKPANLLLDNLGTVKILDMGLARFNLPGVGEQADALTHTGSLMGTVDYMSPEQALDTKTADARADIYSLGCTLYYLLTGRPMYEGDTLMKRLVAHRDEPIPRLAAQRCDLPADLPAVFERMVAKKPDDRYQTVYQVCDELVACAEAIGGSSEPGTCLEVPSGERWKPAFASMPTHSGSTTLQMNPSAQGKRPVKSLSMRTWLGIVAVAIVAIVAGVQLRNRPAAESPKKVFTSLPESAPVPTVPETGSFAAPGSKPSVAEPVSTGNNAVEKAASIDTSPGAPAETKHVGPFPGMGAESPLPDRQPGPRRAAPGKLLENSLDMKLAYIAPGQFFMGSPGAGPGDDERLHLVKLTKGYYLGTHEVTQGDYQRVMEANPSWFSRAGAGSGALSDFDPARLPVDSVTWDEARDFCRRLSALPAEVAAGRVYRLPTEAEWEFACRAGSTGNYHFGDALNGEAANCSGATPFGTTEQGPNLARTAAVGSFAPNALGLYDMHGNVWEWCADWHGVYPDQAVDPPGPKSGANRVARGGSWLYIPYFCRSASRGNYAPAIRSFDGGFRIACDAAP